MIVLIACDIPASDVATASAASQRLRLKFWPARKDWAGLDHLLGSSPCIVLVQQTDWPDDELVELASRVSLAPVRHGGIIQCGTEWGPVSRHLTSAGLLSTVAAPLQLSELTASLVASIDKLSHATDRQSSFGGLPARPSSRQHRGWGDDHPQLRGLLSTITSRRRARLACFPADLFSDPVWDILLSLANARLDNRPTQASNIGIEAGIPPSTALRRVKDLEIAGLVKRWNDPKDRRRDFVQLSDAGFEAFLQYAENISAVEFG